MHGFIRTHLNSKTERKTIFQIIKNTFLEYECFLENENFGLFIVIGNPQPGTPCVYIKLIETTKQLIVNRQIVIGSNPLLRPWPKILMQRNLGKQLNIQNILLTHDR